ncbi:DUF485 domain-containing protein [Pseudothioclava nitratireducens]|jgi:uncharacterized membrane protein (DUF485 family)|uniref:DUF485 domain-containing protein n=1 Tax=Pseudothioclava nitratireducens TaxID=1928646 RepID=UPI0023D9BAA9|nr:DUF485 domain-containing protein [Defluviimonas nitratireducens]MDF1621581.1 DUF485 domain-containing protein [Defluviimonas nitratireducens]
MDAIQEKILANPKFHELVAKRNRFARTLTLIILVVYAAFIAFAIFAPKMFGAPVLSGSDWAIGLLLGWLVQAFAFVMTGIYTRRANGEFDALSRDVLRN